jgi:hypothetical protein
MVRPYAVKGRKKKRKLEEASASDAAPPAEEAEELPPPEVGSGEEKVSEEDEAAAGKEEHAAADGLPILPRMVDGKRQPGAIFVLERACLEVGKVGKVQWFGCSKELLFFSCIYSCSRTNSFLARLDVYVQSSSVASLALGDLLEQLIY